MMAILAKQRPWTSRGNVYYPPVRGSIDWRGSSGVSRRPIVTFAEIKADERYLTPVTLNKLLLRTCYDPLPFFLQQNPSYADKIEVLPDQEGNKVFFQIGRDLVGGRRRCDEPGHDLRHRRQGRKDIGRDA